jgi:hypothetical protein
MQATAASDRTPGRLLAVAQAFFSRPQDLTLQAAQSLAPVSRYLAHLFLNPANKGPEGAVDLVGVHAGLS